MTKTKEHAVSRRTFVKGSALAGLGAAALGTGTLFACSPQGPMKFWRGIGDGRREGGLGPIVPSTAKVAARCACM